MEEKKQQPSETGMQGKPVDEKPQPLPATDVSATEKKVEQTISPQGSAPEKIKEPGSLQPETINDKPETSDMETHAHHLHKAPGHGWKHYLFEFLMLFLAVTLGFFVENLRERMIESHRENEFAKALYSELSDDSVVAANKINIRLEKEKDMDYLNHFFKDSSLTSLPRQFYPAYTTATYLINTYAFEPKDGILSQLRNSGSLRYFKSIALQKLLGELTVYINNMRYRNDQEYQYFASPVKLFILKYYDFGWLDELRKEDANINILDLINNYRQSNRAIEGRILNVSSFNREEACNMILFYKQMLVSTRTLQLNNYIQTNHKILQVLRETYSVEK
jgi:hypothetical protein